MREYSSQGNLNRANNQSNPALNQNKSEPKLKRNQTMNQYINITLDNMGFTKYHFLLFTTNAFILFCEGMQEIIHIILLSMINEKHELTHYHLAFMNSIEYLGYTVAALLLSTITNYIKRKNAILFCVILSLVCTGLSLTTFNFIFAAFNRFILGFCFGILDLLIYLNLFESLPTKIRGFVSTMILLFFPLGEFALSLFCFFKLRKGEIGTIEANYKYMLLIPFIFSCIVCLTAIFFQESPRDLFFGKQEYLKGSESVKNIMLFNNDKNNQNKFDFGDPEIAKATQNIQIEMGQIQQNDEKKEDVLDLGNNYKDNIEDSGLLRDVSYSGKGNRLGKLFHSSYMKYTILFWILGSCGGFVFNGIHFMLPATAPKINKKTFLDLVIFESMEIPPNFFAMLLIENKEIGRKNTIRLGFFITFLISLVNIYLGESILLFDCLLKFSLTVPINVLIVYCSEIYSSDIRTLGLALVRCWRKFASLFSPFFMSYLMYKYGEFYTHLAYSPLLLLAAILSLFLTIETRGLALDEIIASDYK